MIYKQQEIEHHNMLIVTMATNNIHLTSLCEQLQACITYNSLVPKPEFGIK